MPPSFACVTGVREQPVERPLVDSMEGVPSGTSRVERRDVQRLWGLAGSFVLSMAFLVGRCTLGVVDRPAILGLASSTEGASERDAERVVLVLHGVGDDKDGISWLAGALESQGAPSATRYVFLEGPIAHVPGYAWFDRPTTSEVEASRRRVDATIDRLLADGLTPSKLYVAGFSQGASMAVLVVSRRPERLGGFVAIAPCAYRFDWPTVARTPGAARQRGLFAQGSMDRVCPTAATQAIRDTLVSAGHDIVWVPFVGDHTISPEAQLGMVAFLRADPNVGSSARSGDALVNTSLR